MKLLRLLSAALLAAGLSLTPACSGSGGGGGSADDGSGGNAGVDDPVSTCGEALCGYSATGEHCGSCDGAGESLCWAGGCADDSECTLTNFEMQGQSALTPFSGGHFKLNYAATAADFTVVAVAEGEVASCTTDGDCASGYSCRDAACVRPLALKKILINVDHNAYWPEGTPAAGTEIELGGADATEDCDLCVQAGSFCNDRGCGKEYVVESGRLEIVDAGEPGTPFTGVLRDVIFKQVQLDKTDPITGEYKALTNGDRWCLGDYNFSIDVPAPSETEDNCVSEGTGKLIGDNIADFTLTNCYGDEVNLHARCGFRKAVWVVAASGW